jgi:hypothetical protein
LNEKYIVWQVTIWDWYAKIVIPLAVFVTIGVYLFSETYIGALIVTGTIIFVFTAVVWWFWVIYSIASIAIKLQKSKQDLSEVIIEIKTVKKDTNRNNK